MIWSPTFYIIRPNIMTSYGQRFPLCFLPLSKIVACVRRETSIKIPTGEREREREEYLDDIQWSNKDIPITVRNNHRGCGSGWGGIGKGGCWKSAVRRIGRKGENSLGKRQGIEMIKWKGRGMKMVAWTDDE